ncbi:hypothetical protein GCM10010983_16800 [Caulobacter rhizosphaerae]|nr:hypothetical protein GCM10010983_16800 [Caulobacter rhizosphaerae]
MRATRQPPGDRHAGQRVRKLAEALRCVPVPNAIPAAGSLAVKKGRTQQIKVGTRTHARRPGDPTNALP